MATEEMYSSTLRPKRSIRMVARNVAPKLTTPMIIVLVLPSRVLPAACEQSGEYRVEITEWRIQSGEYRVENEYRLENTEWRLQSGE